MNTKRILFWLVFVVVLGLIIWGMTVAINKPASGPSVKEPAPVSAIDHVRGPDSAPVTLMEYSDFQCPACETYYPVVTKLLTDEGDNVRFVYRHFPLPQHQNAVPAAIAAEAAGAQGKFWDMYDLLFSRHTDWTEISDPTDVFVGYARDIGLDVSRFQSDLSSTTLRDRVEADSSEGYNIGINATPTFFINGKAITNPQNYGQFKSAIDQAASTTQS